LCGCSFSYCANGDVHESAGAVAAADTESLKLSAQLERMEQAQRQIAQKIDTIIANQQKILAELEIVKIRATRK